MSATPPSSLVELQPGDPAPWFTQRSSGRESYFFDTAAGRYVVLGFIGSSATEGGKAALAAVAANRRLFDDDTICFFGVSADPADEAEKRVAQSLPGIRYFWDFDLAVSRAYGSVAKDQAPGPSIGFRQFWLVLDPALRVLKRFGFGEEPALFAYLAQLPPVGQVAGGFEPQAPVLFLPNIFPPEFCQRLIGEYEKHGGEASGFMRDVGGKTVEVHDNSHKVRKDYFVEDEGLIQLIQAVVLRRIIPEIRKVHYFEATRMERYLVGCYTADDGGHFMAHRDNTTAGTAHRRFAVSINLNADFEGGELSFPEYGPRKFKPPPGGAVVFSCSLLHAVSRVTAGRRYAFLPFLYDNAAAAIREQNAAKVASGSAYKAQS